MKDILPDLMAFGFGLFGVHQNDTLAKMCGENLDELAGERDFWYEQDNRFLSGKGAFGEMKIDVGFATAGDAMQELSFSLD